MSKRKRHEVQRRDSLSTIPAKLPLESQKQPSGGALDEVISVKPKRIHSWGKLRVYAGRTPVGEGWQNWDGGGVQMYVDLTSLNLRGFPIIIAGLGGRTGISQTTGGDCVLPFTRGPNEPDTNGFRICISWAAPAISPTYVSANQFHKEALTWKVAQTYGWYINWIAISE